MKRKTITTLLTALIATAGTAAAQGLLAMGSDDDFYAALPFTTSLGVASGYDSNPATANGGGGSAFIRGGGELAYGSDSRTSPVRLGLNFSALHYFDQVPGIDDDVYYDAGASVNWRYDISRRLTIGNNFYLAYQTGPDYMIGAADQRGLEPYLYGYNSLWASYAWSRRISTVTRYTIDGINYEDSEVGSFEDRFSQTVAQEFRYAWNRTTTAVLEYRYTSTDYDNAPRNYSSNYILAGADHDFSRTLTGHLRVGAEFRDEEIYGEETRPYAEFSLRNRVADNTTVHWVNRFGLEDADLGTYNSRYTFRTGLISEHAFSDRLRGNIGITYAYSEFTESKIEPDMSENLVSAELGLAYRILPHVDLNTSYTYSGVFSDEAFREYDRNVVSLGVTSTF